MKKIFKRTISAFLVAVIVFGSAPLAGFVGLKLPELKLFSTKAEATTQYTQGYYTYTIDENGNATITDVDTSIGGFVTIPSTFGTHSVTSIGAGSFDLCGKIERITIPDTVKHIENYAFYGCSNLAEINIGKNIEYIGYSAFNGTEYKSNENNWEDGALYIDYCLIEAKNISGRFAVDEGTRVIAALAFRDTEEFQLELPASLQFVSSGFSNNNLTEIIVDKGNPYLFSDEYGVLYDTVNSRLIQYPCGNVRESYNILNGTLVIEEEAFIGCKLKYVTLSNSINRIGASAFRYCDSLIVVDTDYSVMTMGGYFPDYSSDIEGYAFADCSNLERVNLPFSISSIGDSSFSYSNIEVISFSNNVKKIGRNAFGDCNLSDVYFYGDESNWSGILLDEGNEFLENATIHYYIPENNSWQIYSKDFKVSLEYPADEYSGNVGITVEQVFDGNVFDVVDVELGSDNNIIYDIKLTIDGVETQPNSKLTVKIPLPVGYNSSKTFVYYIDTALNRVENMNAEYNDGYLVFETNHFSYYTVIEEIEMIIDIATPTQTSILYGDSIILHADISKIPAGGRVDWSASNDNFEIVEISADGTTCTITPAKKGDTIFTATICDVKGNAVSTDEQLMTSKASLFDKIIAFFKKLFGLTKTIPEAFEDIY